MVLVVLVSGLIPYDSGKTWFTLSVALAVKLKGFKPSIYKPIAGHNLWYSPRTYIKSLELGVLVGNDILAYYEHGLVSSLERANPIDIATMPPDPLRYPSMSIYESVFDDISKLAILSRVHRCKEDSTVHYIHVENLENTTLKNKKLVIKLASKLKALPREFNYLYEYLVSRSVEEDLEACFKMISEGADVVFVEGFNDALTPYLRLLDEAILLVVVAPSRVLIYRDTNSIRKVVLENTLKHGFEGFRSKHVVEHFKPDYTVETGLAVRPRPGKPHREFVEKVLAPLLKS